MNFKQFYLGCLAHASYYIGSGEEAAIIDPQRDVQQYLDEAEMNGQTIKYVVETHSHADFVSGHLELAAKTGAQIIYGQRANTEFPTLKVKDGDKLNVGAIELTFMETPGHTPEGHGNAVLSGVRRPRVLPAGVGTTRMESSGRALALSHSTPNLERRKSSAHGHACQTR